MTVMSAAGVAQAAASVREPAAVHSGADPPLRDLVESYAQDAGMEFLPKARLHEGLQVRAAALGQRCMWTLSGVCLRGLLGMSVKLRGSISMHELSDNSPAVPFFIRLSQGAVSATSHL